MVCNRNVIVPNWYLKDFKENANFGFLVLTNTFSFSLTGKLELDKEKFKRLFRMFREILVGTLCSLIRKNDTNKGIRSPPKIRTVKVEWLDMQKLWSEEEKFEVK